MINIPAEFKDIPEAATLRLANARLDEACERERQMTEQSGERVHLISSQLRHAMDELGRAENAFDAATGEPKRAGLTPAVVDEIALRFPTDQHPGVQELLDKSCGRTLPLLREATAHELEFVRLAVLRLSAGDLTELRKYIELAHVDWRDVVSAARSHG